MKFSWRGVGAGPSQSMGIVDRENILALTNLGWQEVKEKEAAVVFRFSHVHHKHGPDTSGRKSVFYICTTSHNSITSAVVNNYRSISKTKNNYIFVLNREMKENFESLGINCYIWRHGVRTDQFFPGLRPARDKFILGLVGHGCWKRVSFTAESFLAAGLENACLKIISDDPLPPLPGIEVKKASVMREEMASFYRSIDCLVTFSYAEGYNMPPLEALASGVPCVATDMPCMREHPYADLCKLVPASKTLNVEALQGEKFAPRDVSLYAVAPIHYEVSAADAVSAIRESVKLTRPPSLGPGVTWEERIRNEVFPVIEAC